MSVCLDIACPGCDKVGTYSKIGLICRECPSPMPPGATLYHRCKDGTIRIIPGLTGEFLCSVCKTPTRDNAPVPPLLDACFQKCKDSAAGFVPFVYDYVGSMFSFYSADV